MRVAAFFAAALATFAVGRGMAAAAPVTDPAYLSWMTHAHSPSGDYCCTQDDIHPVLDGDWRTGVPVENGMSGYEVRIGGMWVPVPATRVLLDNPTGQSVVWYAERRDGPFVYCFAPGQLS